MFLIAYSSLYTGLESNLISSIEQIVQSSKVNNRRDGITGVMFYHSGRFLQFLEGEREVVETAMEKISLDERHNEIKYLFKEEIEERGLAQWNMDCFNIDQQEPLKVDFLELIATGYRKTLKTETETLVGLYKDFIESR